MEKQVCESPKITDYFQGNPEKDSRLSESICKDNVRLEDILPTPETSPVKDKAENHSNTDLVPTGVSPPDCKTDKAPNNAREKLAERFSTEDPFVDKAGKENITDNKSDPVSGSSDVVRPKSGSKKGRKRRGRQKKSEVKGSGSEAQGEVTPVSTPEARPKTQRKKKADPAANNHVLTDYFPVRRSNRQSVSNKKKDEESRIEDAVLNGKEVGLKVVEFEGKGRGVIATQDFHRGRFVVEYAGDLIDLSTAKLREMEYAQSPEKFGCYMYYFTHKNKNYCVDATLESGRLGRLLNHSKKGNCHTKLTEVKGTPRLILVASRDIESGEELLYDYGDRSKSSLEAHPWLKS